MSNEKKKQHGDHHDTKKHDANMQEEHVIGENESPREDVSEDVNADKWHDQYIRVSADFQNYKRRVEKEKARWTTYAQMDVVNALLPFIDELQLSIKSSKKTELDEKTKQWLDGFKMIYANAQKALEKLGVTEIDCSGSFDPMYHEALLHVDSDAHESGEIVDVFTPGYMLGGEVVRHARVSVAK